MLPSQKINVIHFRNDKYFTVFWCYGNQKTLVKKKFYFFLQKKKKKKKEKKTGYHH